MHTRKLTLLRLAGLVLLASLSGSLARAQTVTVQASHFGGTGTEVTGTIYFAPALINGRPASFKQANGGVVTVTPVQATVTAGVFSVTLPDTNLTVPAHVCYITTATSTKGPLLGPGFTCVQPHGTAIDGSDWCQAGVCNFDNFPPYLPALPVQYIAISPGAYLPLAGGALTGPLVLPADPTLSLQAATKQYVDNHSSAQVQADWTATSGLGQILNKPTLATVATSGSYNDLSSKPTIPAAQVNSDWSAGSGVAQILNKPTIPAAQVNSDWTAGSGLAQILNKPTIPTVPTLISAFTNDANYLTALTVPVPSVAGRTGAVTLNLADIGPGAVPTGLFDFSAATLKASNSAGFVTTSTGMFGHDTTNKNWHFWDNSQDNFLAIFPSGTPPVSGDCSNFLLIGTAWSMADAGHPCNTYVGTLPASLLPASGPDITDNFDANGSHSGSYGIVHLGDSISSAGGGGATTYALNYGGLLNTYASAVGAPVATYAVSFSNAADQAFQALANVSPSDTGNPIYTTLIGTNDVLNSTALPANVVPFAQNFDAANAWLALSSTNKVFVNNATYVTQGGTWTPDSTFAANPGLVTSASGATLTDTTCTIGPKGVLYVFSYIYASSTGTWQLSVDGTVQTDTVSGLSTLTSQQAAGNLGVNHPTVWASMARFAGISQGTHTCVITTTAAGSSGFFSFAFPPSQRYRGNSSPAVFVGAVPYEQGNANATKVAFYNQQVINNIAQLDADGLYVKFVNINEALDYNLDFTNVPTQNCGVGGSVPIHPNNCGHLHMFQAFMDAIKPTGVVVTGTSGPTIPLNNTANTFSGANIFTGLNTFTNNGNTFKNGTNSELDLAIQPGASGDFIGALAFNGFSGTNYWKVGKNNGGLSNQFFISNSVTGKNRLIFAPGASTLLTSEGTSAVQLNYSGVIPGTYGTGGVQLGSQTISGFPWQVTDAGLTTFNAATFYGNLTDTQATMAAINSVYMTTQTTGGSLLDGTSYCYKGVGISQNNGMTAPTAEACITTGTTGSNANTVTISMTNGLNPGLIGYKFGCRTTGAELFCTPSMVQGVTWVDTGAATPSGALPTTNTTGGLLTMLGGANLSGGPLNLKAGPAGNVGVVLNAMGTSAIQFNYPGNTTVGPATGGMFYQSGTLSGMKPWVVTDVGSEQIGGILNYGAMTNTALATPNAVTLAAATSGGTLTDSTQYCYRSTATGANAGNTLPSAETCITTGVSGSNTNSITISQAFNANSGFVGSKVYGRTTGAELLMFTNAYSSTGSGTVSWIDTGSVTPSGALPVANTTLGNVTGAVGAFQSVTNAGTLTQTGVATFIAAPVFPTTYGVGAVTVTQPTATGKLALTPVSAAITSATGGSGIGALTCTTAACTNLRGTYSVPSGTFVTGNVVVLVWPTTTTAYVCTVVQNGGTTLGLGHSVATATGMNVTNAVTVTGVAFSFDYSCQP